METWVSLLSPACIDLAINSGTPCATFKSGTDRTSPSSFSQASKALPDRELEDLGIVTGLVIERP